MQKRITGIIMAVGLLLFASCGPKTDIPVKPTDGDVVPTATEIPTCTPKATEPPTVTSVPTPTITEAAKVTVVPSPVLKPTAAPEPTKAPTPVPTEPVQPTATPEPTETPEPTAALTESPVPTEEPEPTRLPEVTPTEPVQPTATPSPTPAVNPETLVNYGWQKTVSIDEKYGIVFPEVFRESVVIKDDRELCVQYTCPEEAGIELRIVYLMQQSLEEVENTILSADGTILEGSLAERKVVLEWKENGFVYRGTFSEEQYDRTLLGASFGEAEQIVGVMQVIFAYPEERRAEFEAAEFNYYIIRNGEE